MRTDPKTINDITNTSGHITKLTRRANAESNQIEKYRLLDLIYNEVNFNKYGNK
jgi:hypothetical protein